MIPTGFLVGRRYPPPQVEVHEDVLRQPEGVESRRRDARASLCRASADERKEGIDVGVDQ